MTMLRSAAASFILSLVTLQYSAEASAQRYPAKAVRYLVADAAGSGSDTIARVITPGLTAVFGQQVLVDNRPGATGTIGADLAAKAPADGYTVLQISSAVTAAASLYRGLSYDLARDFATVTQLATAPQVAVVHPSLPVKSIAELVKLAKSKPNALVFGSAGSASSTHLAGEMLKADAGIEMLHVAYRGGGPAITAVISGETSIYFAPVAAALPHIKQGRLRTLAVTTAQRVPLMPEVPTMAEAGISGYQTGQWYGLLVPAKTPRELIGTLREATASVLATPAVNKRLVDMGYIVIGDQPEEFSAHLKNETERLGKVIRRLGLKAE
jgi:tripartite-type tricarboxylate transporter receptor subunit TctC